MAQLEHKFLAADPAALSLKAEDGKPAIICGYASTFGGEPDSYGDVIEAGAYAGTIKSWGQRGHALPMLLEHGGLPIGKWPVELLREDGKGLYGEGELTPNHSLAADVEASARHGAISGISIGYRVKKAELDRKNGIRRLIEIDLREISIVANPANGHARVTGIKGDIETIRDFEAFLVASLGCSRGWAKAVAAEGFKAAATSGMERGGVNGNGDPRDEADGAKLLEALRGVRLDPLYPPRT